MKKWISIALVIIVGKPPAMLGRLPQFDISGTTAPESATRNSSVNRFKLNRGVCRYGRLCKSKSYQVGVQSAMWC